jgi:ligand-binding SRPBCC domain-containing protein
VRTHTLERQQWIGRPLEEVFDFFSRAENLALITPPWMYFDLKTPVPIEMSSGTRIEYRISLLGVPMRWRTLIGHWSPGSGFSDFQERGPYAWWEHHHKFHPMGGGVLMTDRVSYRLPFGWIGLVAHWLVVRRALDAIFDFRFERIEEILTDRVGAKQLPEPSAKERAGHLSLSESAERLQ